MLKSKKDKRELVKHPCSICSSAVGDKNGLQCQGACKRWVHFSCMNYSPSKIRDIQNGTIEITCPCPNCDNQTKIRKTCDNAACPANKSKLYQKQEPIPDLLNKNEVQHMSETINEEQQTKRCKHNSKRKFHNELSPILKQSPLQSQTRPIKFKESLTDEPDSPRQYQKPHSLRPLQIPLPLELLSESPQKYIEPPYFPHKRHQHQHHRTLDTSPTHIPQQQFQPSPMQTPVSQTSDSQQEKSLEEQLQIHQHDDNCPPGFENYPIPKSSEPIDAIFPTQDLRQPQHQWAATKMSHNELYNLQNRPNDTESISYESAIIRLDGEETLPPIVLENQQNEERMGQWTITTEFLENNSQNEASQPTLNNSYALKQTEVDFISDQVLEPQLKHPISVYTSYPDVLTSLSASHLKHLSPHYHIQQDKNQSQVGQTPYQQHIDQQMAGMNQNLLRNCYLPMQYPLPILLPHTMNQQQQILDHIQQQQITQTNQQQQIPHQQQQQIAQSNQQQKIPHQQQQQIAKSNQQQQIPHQQQQRIPQKQQEKQQISQPQHQHQKKQQASQLKQQQQKKQQVSKSQQQRQQVPQPQIPQSHQHQQLQQQLQQQPYHQMQIPYQIPQYPQQNPQVHQLPPQQQILIRQPIYQQPLYDPRLPQYVQIPQYAQPYPQYQIPQTPPPQYQRIPTIQQKNYPQLPYVQLIPQNQQLQSQMYQKQYRNTCKPTQLLNQCIDNQKSQEFNTRHKTPSFITSPAMNVVTGISEEALIQRISLSLGTSTTPTAAATPIPLASPTPNISSVAMSPMTPLTSITPATPISVVTPRTPQTPRSPATLGSHRDDVSMKTISNRTNYSRQETLTSLSMSCLSISENNLKPAHPSKSDSQVSVPSDRRRVLISAMEQMYETMGHFHTQFRDLMCRMMTIFEDRP